MHKQGSDQNGCLVSMVLFINLDQMAESPVPTLLTTFAYVVFVPDAMLSLKEFQDRSPGHSAVKTWGVFRSLKNHPKIQTFHHISITSKY